MTPDLASMSAPGMYNAAFFWDRQESTMPAKKQASKKRKAAGAARRKSTSRKAPSRKKTSGKKAKVTRKKSTAKKSTAKKSASRKKAASKKKTASRPSKKKATKKKAAGKKKPAASKKQTSAKKTAKKTSAKKASKKKAQPAKKASRKKAPARKAAARPSARKTAPKSPPRKRGDVLSGPIHGIEPYKARRGEEYMSPEQLEHFRAILLAWKRELMNEVDRTLHHMKDEAANFPDPNDRATQESEFGLELRTRDRERKLLRKINSALERIDDGSYGFCEETGEEIGLKRLEARPVATMCLEAQERREMAERQFRDRDDRYR